jgi:DNA polymerase-3 subunit beta
MKATINAADLRGFLKSAKPFVSNKVIPILETVQFKAAGNRVTVTVTDLENFFQVHMPAAVDDPGEVCLPFSDLSGFIQTCKDHVLNIEADQSGKANISGFKLQGQGIEYGDNGERISQFPELPELTDTQTLDFSPLLFHELNVASNFLSKDDSRPVMAGANIAKRNGLLTIAATDAHRLYKAEICPYDNDFNIIINGLAVRQVPKVFDTTANVTVQFNERNAVFEQRGIRLISRLIDGRYPDINAVIPQDNPVQVTFDKKQLAAAINQVKIAANKKANQVVFTVADGRCKLYACDIDMGTEMETTIPCRGEGEIEIAFNFKFLLEILAQQLSPEVTLELSTANRAGVIKEYHRTYLLMPVMIVKPEEAEAEAEMEEEYEEEEAE